MLHAIEVIGYCYVVLDCRMSVSVHLYTDTGYASYLGLSHAYKICSKHLIPDAEFSFYPHVSCTFYPRC